MSILCFSQCLLFLPGAKDADDLKDFFLFLVMNENCSIEDAEDSVGNAEEEKMKPDQLEHASVPDEDQPQESHSLWKQKNSCDDF